MIVRILCYLDANFKIEFGQCNHRFPKYIEYMPSNNSSASRCLHNIFLPVWSRRFLEWQIIFLIQPEYIVSYIGSLYSNYTTTTVILYELNKIKTIIIISWVVKKTTNRKLREHKDQNGDNFKKLQVKVESFVM